MKIADLEVDIVPGPALSALINAFSREPAPLQQLVSGGAEADLTPGPTDLLDNGIAPSFNPEHDSLFLRFEQLDKLLVFARAATPSFEGGLNSDLKHALDLVRLIRAQVMK